LIDSGSLFGGDGFGQVAGVVYVDAVGDRDEVGEELERDDFDDGKQVLCGGVDEDAVGDDSGDFGVASVGDGECGCALLLHVAEELEGLLVTKDGVGIGVVDGGEHDERNAGADEGVRAVLQLASGVALGVQVGGLFELERSLAGDGVVDAASQEEKGAGVEVAGGDLFDGGLPLGELGGDEVGQGFEGSEVLGYLGFAESSLL